MSFFYLRNGKCVKFCVESDLSVIHIYICVCVCVCMYVHEDAVMFAMCYVIMM